MKPVKTKGAVSGEKARFGDSRILAIIPVLLVFFVYFNSIKNDFVWDDQTVVLRNEAVKSFKHIPYVFKNEFAEKAGYNGNIYRPMQEISYMVDYWLWGTNSKGFHFTNVLLQAACAALLFYFVKQISSSGIVALITSGIFGVHPINTEAVSYVSGRSDPLYFLFLLASFICYLKYFDSTSVKRALFYMCSLVLCAASLSSRETAIVFPFLLMAHGRFLSKEKKVSWNGLLPFIALLGLYLFLRLKVIDFNAESVRFFGVEAVLFTDAKIIFKYFSLILFPLNLHMARVMPLSAAPDLEVFIGCIVIAFFAALSLKMKKTKPDLLFWVFWFFILLLPHLNIIGLNALYAEHWIYGASVGIYALFAFMIKRLIEDKRTMMPAYIFCIGVLVYLSSLTMMRNKDWRDEPSIYLNTLKYSRSPKVLSNFGVYYDIKGEYDKAIELYKEALKTDPRQTWYHNNIAVVYAKKGDIRNAIRHWEISLSINPDQEDVKAALFDYKRSR